MNSVAFCASARAAPDPTANDNHVRTQFFFPSSSSSSSLLTNSNTNATGHVGKTDSHSRCKEQITSKPIVQGKESSNSRTRNNGNFLLSVEKKEKNKQTNKTKQNKTKQNKTKQNKPTNKQTKQTTHLKLGTHNDGRDDAVNADSLAKDDGNQVFRLNARNLDGSSQKRGRSQVDSPRRSNDRQTHSDSKTHPSPAQ
jgi:hypothetical protein